jgi:hypothetical protein
MRRSRKRRSASFECEEVGVTHTLEVTDDELRLIHAALHSYLDDFGHEEADVLRAVKALIGKLDLSEA